ncbi:MAG TPA: GTPase, partial [Lacipirellulaceae bacterium]|nr:GTPase [Lacipirellulaceae bacterium]
IVGHSIVSQGAHSIDATPIGRIGLAHWSGPGGEEVVVCRRDEHHVEIHCHGGTAAVRSIVSQLEAEGCQPISWQAWLRRVSSGSICAAAHIELSNALTERTAAILVDQLQGALSAAIRAIVNNVAAASWDAARVAIHELLGRSELGVHLTKPWRVVVFGVPNVGKSSLINALAGYERAIVSPFPGTTRDVVTVAMAIDGWPVLLADTAGFRPTHDDLESAGVELAATMAAKADLLIRVEDATSLTDERSDCHIESSCSSVVEPARAIRVINKIDLIPSSDRPRFFDRLISPDNRRSNVLVVSALTGDGIAQFSEEISRVLVPIVPRDGSGVPFTADQIAQLDQARIAIERQDASPAIQLLHAMLE